MKTRDNLPHIVVFTGSGISADSGIPTYRGSGGLWNGHSWQELASPGGFARNPELVLEFYNTRRKDLLAIQPNAAHLALVALATHYPVSIITQNVDDLHERAGSQKVLHLHGELMKARSVTDPSQVIFLEGDIRLGDVGEDGSQLRPHIVWFGEEVPMMLPASQLVKGADILLIVGTSLTVYPANTLVDYLRPGGELMVVDPEMPELADTGHPFRHIADTAAKGVPVVVKELIGRLG